MREKKDLDDAAGGDSICSERSFRVGPPSYFGGPGENLFRSLVFPALAFIGRSDSWEDHKTGGSEKSSDNRRPG